MARFDRYMLGQLLTLFGFFSLILVLVLWIKHAVRMFDRLIADGQSAWVFLELTSLSLPGLIRIVLPLSAFVAAVYVTNRMSAESELTVVQATGYSPFRLARPVLYFGAIVAVLMMVFTHFLVPLSSERLTLRSDEIAQNLTARLLTPGEFLSPTDGITFYIREISQSGEMLDIFISEDSDPDRRVTYTASRAYLVRNDTGPQLVMVNGLTQTLNTQSGRLATTGFDNFVYDVGALVSDDGERTRSLSALMSWELWFPSPELLSTSGQSTQQLRLLVHDRFAQASLGFVAGLIGFSALVAGGFSRFGLWRNILFAVLLIVALKALETVGAGVAAKTPSLWPLMYLAAIGGFICSMALLYVSQRPYFFKRKPASVRMGTS
ncbi:LPS export ABC transporter permease LptF [Octadecabacter sp.]|nr:LPS export ABC transporter permease LptF [Octadecabacter sp.]MDC1499702.1 LPS export ABC transporter permease LptF [Octadecabacter sp.]